MASPLRKPVIWAHRGVSVEGGENTLPAFRQARAVGADGVELDVRLTADGVVVVHHDADLARTAGRDELLADLERASLPPFIPTLTEVLDLLEGSTVNIELKNAPSDPDFDDTARIARATAAVLRTRGTDDVIVSAFHLRTLDRFHALAPLVPTGLLQLPDIDPAHSIATATERGHSAVHPFDLVVDEAYVVAAHAAGLAVNVWTVDEPDRIVELAEMGVDAVITNVPDVALRALGR